MKSENNSGVIAAVLIIAVMSVGCVLLFSSDNGNAPTPAPSADEGVEYNGVVYETINEAIANVDGEGTLNLLSDMTEDVVVDGKAIKLNMCGNTLTAASEKGVSTVNGALLTLVGGTVAQAKQGQILIENGQDCRMDLIMIEMSESTQSQAVDNLSDSLIDNYGFLYLIGSSVISENTFCINNRSNLTVSEGSVIRCTAGTAITSVGNVTINDGMVYGSTAIMMDGGTFLTLEKGTIGDTNTQCAIKSGGTVTINAGEVNGVSGIEMKGDEFTQLSINGGTITGAEVAIQASCNVIIYTGVVLAEDTAIVMSSNTHLEIVDGYIMASNAIKTDNSSFITIYEGEISGDIPAEGVTYEAQAKITGNESTRYFVTLVDAVNQAIEGDEITLLNDCTGAPVVVEDNITINFNDKTYICDKATSESNFSAVFVADGATVTLKNGIIGSAPYAFLGYIVESCGNLTVDNMELNGLYLSTRHVQYSSSLNVASGTTKIVGSGNGSIISVLGDATAINVDDGATLFIGEKDNNTVNSGRIEVSGTATIDVGFFSQFTYVEAKGSGNVTLVNGIFNDIAAISESATMIVGNADTTSLIVSSVELYSGNLIIDNGSINGGIHVESGNLTINGGTFTGASLSVGEYYDFNQYSIKTVNDGFLTAPEGYTWSTETEGYYYLQKL